MTAYGITRSDLVPVPSLGRSRLLGLRPLVRKELQEWLASRRAPILLVITSLMMILNTLSARLAELSADAAHTPLPPSISFDATFNVLGKWDQWVFFFAIVFSVSLLVGERDRGTLAWSLSKPLSRSALLVGKWIGAMVMFVTFGLVLPMALCVVTATVVYGMPDLGAVALATVLLAAVPAFFIALTLAAATLVPSQAAVGGIAVAVAIAPGLIGTFVPDLAAVLPPSIGPWAIAVALGAAVPAWAPIGWSVGLALVATVGLVAIRRRDL